MNMDHLTIAKGNILSDSSNPRWKDNGLSDSVENSKVIRQEQGIYEFETGFLNGADSQLKKSDTGQ